MAELSEEQKISHIKAVRKFQLANPDKVKQWHKNFRENNKERRAKQKKEYYEKNKQRILAHNSEYKKNHRSLYNKRDREYSAKRRNKDAVFLLICMMRSSISRAIRGKSFSKKTQEIFGCTKNDFFNYIESKFKEGMTWDNRIKWEIDHKIPFATAKTICDVIKLSHYTNLQPLWKEENIKKGTKIL